MKKSLTAAAVLVLGLAGCSSSDDAAAPSSSGNAESGAPSSSSSSLAESAAVSASSGPVPTFASKKSAANERSNIPKEIGEQAGITGCGGTDGACLTFAVTEITRSQTCPGTPEPPVNGEYVTVRMNVETTAEAQSNIEAVSGNLGPFHWSAIDADGMTLKGLYSGAGANAQWCYPMPSFEGALSPSSKYTGQMAFDLPKGTVALVLERPGGNKGNGPGGWEWQVPQ